MGLSCILSSFYRLLHETKLKVRSRRSGRLAEAVDEEAVASVADEVPPEDDIKTGRPADPRLESTGELRTHLNSPFITFASQLYHFSCFAHY